MDQQQTTAMGSPRASESRGSKAEQGHSNHRHNIAPVRSDWRPETGGAFQIIGRSFDCGPQKLRASAQDAARPKYRNAPRNRSAIDRRALMVYSERRKDSDYVHSLLPAITKYFEREKHLEKQGI